MLYLFAAKLQDYTEKYIYIDYREVKNKTKSP